MAMSKDKVGTERTGRHLGKCHCRAVAIVVVVIAIMTSNSRELLCYVKLARNWLFQI